MIKSLFDILPIYQYEEIINVSEWVKENQEIGLRGEEIVKKYKVSIVFPPPVFSSAYVAPQKSIAHMSFSVNGLGERLCFICDLRS